MLRNVPVRQKLVLIVMLASGSALLLASAGLIAFDFVRFRTEMAEDLASTGRMIAANSTAAASFRDEDAAYDTLESLRARPTIVEAAIYDDEGGLLAVYPRSAGASVPARPAAGVPPPEPALVVFEPIRHQGESLGTVYLRGDPAPLYERLRLQAVTVMLVLVVAALAALLVSSGLQRVISSPIQDLAELARAVSERRDYSLRATKHGADELGQLVDAFNGMLAQIQERDTALLEAKADLERRVGERTRELQAELAERRRAEALLERSNAELAQSNKELDDFAYVASHDLKEPLRGLHNYSLFLLEDYGEKLDADGRAKLETLVRLCRRMESLIDSLLHYSRVGRVDLAIGKVDLNDTLAGVLDSLGINLEAERVEVRIPRPLPTVRADRARVGEIFRNLISNAVKYNDKPEKWVEIGCENGAGRPPVFWVRDNGIGIPEKHHDAVFRIFKRLHARDKFGGGTGAGLTIVKKIVERHDGQVWVESTPGAGTTVYFTLEKGKPT